MTYFIVRIVENLSDIFKMQKLLNAKKGVRNGTLNKMTPTDLLPPEQRRPSKAYLANK